MYQDNDPPTPAKLLAHVLGEDAQSWLVTFVGRQARLTNPDARHNELVDIRQRSFRYPAALDDAAAYLLRASHHKYDAYFAVHLFRESGSRLASKATPTVRSLWLDEDEGCFPEIGPEPTAVVRSSQNRRHLYWRLTRPIPAEEAVDLNRRIAAWANGDSGKAGLASVLRSPGTKNFKRYPQVDPVTLEFSDRIAAWEPETIDQAIPQLPQRDLGPGRAGPYTGPEIEIADYLNELEQLTEEPDGRGRKWAITCPWVADHTGRDRTGTYVGQLDTGAPWFHCYHNGCTGRRWRHFRRVIVPKSQRIIYKTRGGFPVEVKIEQ